MGYKKINILSWAQWEILDNLGGCFTCHKITFQIIPKRKSRSKTGQQSLGHIFKITNYWIWLADIGCIFWEWYLRVYWWYCRWNCENGGWFLSTLPDFLYVHSIIQCIALNFFSFSAPFTFHLLRIASLQQTLQDSTAIPFNWMRGQSRQ